MHMGEQEVQEEDVYWFCQGPLSKTDGVLGSLTTVENKNSGFSKSQRIRADASKIGIQGAHLNALYQRTFSIPPGFVISTSVCKSFFTENKIAQDFFSALSSAASASDEALAQTSERLRKQILSGNFNPRVEEAVKEAYEILNTDVNQLGGASTSALTILKNSYEPPFVAVRSSSPLEKSPTDLPAFMNVKGMQSVLDAVKQCYAGLVSPKELRANAERSTTEIPAIAVIIQKMIDADISGYITPRGKERYLIEAVWGLGDLLAHGEVEPDRYEVGKEHEMMTVREVRVGNKERAMTRDASGKNIIVPLNENRKMQQLLTAPDAQRLAKIAEMISVEFEEPQRIAFVLTHGELSIVGCTPCTLPAESAEILEETQAEQTQIEVPAEDTHEIPVQTPAPNVPEVAVIAPVVATMSSLPEPVSVPLEGHESSARLALGAGVGEPVVYHIVAGNDYANSLIPELSTVAQVASLALILPGHLSSVRARHVYGALQAILRIRAAAPKTSLTVLVPHVTHVRHFTDVRELAHDLGIDGSVHFGIQIDTPAAVQLIGKLCDAGVTHIDIDIASLAQHALGRRTIPGEREFVNPAVLSALQYVHRRASRNAIPVTLALPHTFQPSGRQLETLANSGVRSYTVGLPSAAYVAQLLGLDLHWPEPYSPERASTQPEDIEQVVLRELENAKEDYQPGYADRRKADIPPLV